MRRISISDGRTVLYAVLNDTVAARDFARRLPCRMTGTDSGTDYCFPAASGIYDPMETRVGWENGDLCLCGGYFAILYGGAEGSGSCSDMVLIGRLEAPSLKQIEKWPDRVTVKVAPVSSGESEV